MRSVGGQSEANHKPIDELQRVRLTCTMTIAKDSGVDVQADGDCFEFG